MKEIDTKMIGVVVMDSWAVFGCANGWKSAKLMGEWKA